jgi:hypothetical protein
LSGFRTRTGRQPVSGGQCGSSVSMKPGASAQKRVPSDPSMQYRCEVPAKASEVIFAGGPVKRAAGLRPVGLPTRPGPARLGFWAGAAGSNKSFSMLWSRAVAWARLFSAGVRGSRLRTAGSWGGAKSTEHIDHSTQSAPARCGERIWPAVPDRASPATAKAAGM